MGGEEGGEAAGVNRDVAKELQRAKMFVDGQEKGEGQTKQDNAVAMTAVIAAVTRDKEREISLMKLARLKLAKLKEKLQQQQALANQERLGAAAGQGTAAEDDKKLATAKELLLKAKALKAQSERIEKKAFEENFSKSASLEHAMQKQQAMLDHLKEEENIAQRKEKAKADLQMAKRLSSQSIKELKLAGMEIKKSEAFMKLNEKKAGKKLQQESQKLTEKAVHTMLRSRRVSHKATDDLNSARSVSAELPGLEIKGKQAQLVLNVLKAQAQAAKAKLRTNPAYLHATALSHKMSAQAARDIKLAGDLMKEGEEEEAKRRAGLQAGTLKEVAETRKRLWGLRAKLERQEKFIKSDGAILDALSQQK